MHIQTSDQEKLDLGFHDFTCNQAEMTWALKFIPCVEELMVCEFRLNHFIPGEFWISIYEFNTSKFGGLTTMKVQQTHLYTITKRTVTQNPLYQNPDAWLKKNAPEYVKKE